jgi:hypothetical protein
MELTVAEAGHFYPKKIQMTLEEIRVTKVKTREY